MLFKDLLRRKRELFLQQFFFHQFIGHIPNPLKPVKPSAIAVTA